MADGPQRGFEDFFMDRPASIEQLIDGLSEEVYDSLRLAVEIGKWSDGRRLDAEQVDYCMQAIILYEAKHLPESDRVGFDLSSSCASKVRPSQTQTITLVTGTPETDAVRNKP